MRVAKTPLKKACEIKLKFVLFRVYIIREEAPEQKWHARLAERQWGCYNRNKSDEMAQEYFDFTNDLIFRWVMEHEENCLAILRAILPELKITAVKRRENEHPVNYLAFDDERGVRFDAIIEDDQERFYDVEMQIANQPGLGKRIRYYQAVLCPVKLTL